jgi:hypothetical protein
LIQKRDLSLVGDRMTEQKSSQSLLRYRRFSLRALIAFVLASGCGLGIVIHVIRGAERQRRAVASITSAGGSVWYDRGFNRSQIVERGTICGPSWLLEHVGVDFVGNAIQVALPDSATDDDLSYVGQLPELEAYGHLRRMG